MSRKVKGEDGIYYFEQDEISKAKGRAKQKLKDKTFETMTRPEKDELLKELLIMQGLIDTE